MIISEERVKEGKAERRWELVYLVVWAGIVLGLALNFGSVMH